MKWILFAPEFYYLAGAFWFLVSSSVKRSHPRQDYRVALALAAAGVVICLLCVRLEGVLFLASYQVDLFSQIFKIMLAIGLLLTLILCSELDGVETTHHPEFYLLLFISSLAMMMLASTAHLLSIYVALELSSYSLYVLVALRKGYHIGIEAGLKYFLIGVCASAVMLFGLALLYGTTQAAYLKDLVAALPAHMDSPLAAVGLLLALGGFFFKLAVFPFHFWAPDVYQGAANQVTTFIATASKVAAVAIILRVVAAGASGGVYLVHVLVALSIISMTVGNLAAIVQKDLKRLLAYSSIAHAGYVLIGVLSMNQAGYAATIYYALAILLMKFTCFMVIIKVAYDGRNLQVDELAGLHRRSPILALALMTALFGLAGLPPTVGFTGKLLVFMAAMEKGYFTLILIAMINVVISLYYYLLVLKAAYLLEPAGGSRELRLSASSKVLTGSLITAMVVAGIFPRHLIALAEAAAKVLV